MRRTGDMIRPMAPERMLRTIHVGVGTRGGVHLAHMAADPRFRSVAGVDVVQAYHDAAVEKHRVPRDACFRTLGEALARIECDAVVISTPVTFHGQQIEEALAAGRHVMVEKPFTIDLAQAERIVRTAAERGLKVMVTQNARYLPALHTMARLVRERAYGEPGYFNLIFHKARPQPYNDSPHQQLWQMSIHDLDVIRSIIPGEPRRVWCRETSPPWTKYPTPPCVSALIEFDTGVSGVYLGSSDSKTRHFEMRVECAGGALVNREWGGALALCRGKEEIALPTDVHPSDRTFDSMMPHLFYEYVVNGVEPPISGRHNLGTMRLANACRVSAETGQIAEVG